MEETILDLVKDEDKYYIEGFKFECMPMTRDDIKDLLNVFVGFKIAYQYYTTDVSVPREEKRSIKYKKRVRDFTIELIIDKDNCKISITHKLEGNDISRSILLDNVTPEKIKSLTAYISKFLKQTE